MEKLYFVCQWGRRRERAWSGTYLKVFEALKKQFDVVDVSIDNRFITLVKNYIRKRIGLGKYDFGYGDVLKFNKSRKCADLRGNKCVFQFTEFNQSEETHSYIYQDMCVRFICDEILNNPDLSKYFQKNVSSSVLRVRIERQDEYYKHCKGIFVMGQWLKTYMVEKMNIPENKVFCVGAGYDINVGNIRKEKRNGNRILFVGRDFERKGGRNLLDAFKIYKEEYNGNAELYIAGAGVQDESLRDVHWLGDIGSDELVHYYCYCDVLCMPSFLEPFGKVYIEALCCGMPVIALNRFATPDFIKHGHNGYLLDECTSEILAEKIYELLLNDDIKRNAIEEAEYYQKEYSWDAVAEKISRVIDKDEYYNQT